MAEIPKSDRIGRQIMASPGVMKLRFLTEPLSSREGKHFPIGFVAQYLLEGESGSQLLTIAKQPGTSHSPAASVQEAKWLSPDETESPPGYYRVDEPKTVSVETAWREIRGSGVEESREMALTRLLVGTVVKIEPIDL